jgi:hypothetical protein
MYIQMDGKVSGTIGGSEPTSSAEPSKTKDKPTEAPTVSITPPILRASFFALHLSCLQSFSVTYVFKINRV